MQYTTKATPKAQAGNIPVFCAHDEIIELEKLIPNPRNPNTHPETQVELLGKIIKAQGWRQPITVSRRSGFIVKGHGRLMAAQAAGLDFAPVDYQDYATEAEEYADLIADNRLAELSEMNTAMLADIFKGLDFAEVPVELTGYTEAHLEEMSGLFEDMDTAEELAEDTVPPAEIDREAITQPGDVWHIGDHRLICGDSTRRETFTALLGQEMAQIIVTDPPYNVAYEGGTKDKLTIQNDNMSDEKFLQFLTAAFVGMADVCTPGAAVYIWHADSEGVNFRAAMKAAGIKQRQTLIWVKNALVLGRQDYQWKHEPCLYGWVDGAHYFVDDRKQSTVTEAEPIQVEKLTKKELQAMLQAYLDRCNAIEATVIHEKKPTRSDLHPTMKPIKLISRQLLNSSRRGWLVLDPFGGSGTTLISAELTGRRARLIELDEWYCDVIVKRYAMTTGKTDIRLIRGGEEQPREVYAELLEAAKECTE